MKNSEYIIRELIRKLSDLIEQANNVLKYAKEKLNELD
tara:strand:+ start:138 stop:251 length:114 start_codon:yes stop_codon:yes gene_type:complete